MPDRAPAAAARPDAGRPALAGRTGEPGVPQRRCRVVGPRGEFGLVPLVFDDIGVFLRRANRQRRREVLAIDEHRVDVPGVVFLLRVPAVRGHRRVVRVQSARHRVVVKNNIIKHTPQ